MPFSSQAWAETEVCSAAAVSGSVTIGAVYVIRATAVAALVTARVGAARGVVPGGGGAGASLDLVESEARVVSTAMAARAATVDPPVPAARVASAVASVEVSVRSSRVMACPFGA
ncbi:hypothetical protein GCM10023335_07220 [Streptomyces siamensis]|uniref:Uncharacterized protein n=1 Tax=Streptomyces siamensis TaxID=1274986 RepID=A0ABP9IGZ9_9ACTN